MTTSLFNSRTSSMDSVDNSIGILCLSIYIKGYAQYYVKRHPMEQFGVGAATFGQFSGVYYIGYSLMHLPVGIMLDRYGPRKIMTACILLTVAGFDASFICRSLDLSDCREIFDRSGIFCSDIGFI